MAHLVEHHADEHRYTISVDGKPAGFTAYRDRGDQRVFHHTEIDDAFAGQGLASALVTEALRDVRESGKRVVPVCPYWARWVKKHEEAAGVTDPVTPDILQWLSAQLAG
jgi:predicted GNAT family acetyltransferase